MYRTKQRFDDIKQTLQKLEGILEVALLAVIYYAVWRNFYNEADFPTYHGNGKYLLMAVYAMVVIVLFRLGDGFKFGDLKMTDILISQSVSLFVANIITYFQLCLIANRMVSPLPMLSLLLLDIAVVFLCIYGFTRIFHRYNMPRTIALVYDGDSAISIKFAGRPDQFRIANMISVEKGVEAICKEIIKYDAIVINEIPRNIRSSILKFCYRNKIRTYVVATPVDIMMRGAEDICLFDTPLLLIKGFGLTLSQRFVKRAFDIVLSLVATIVAAPFMLIIAAAIKIEDGGPVIYQQARATRGGRVFNIFKFRSMIVNAERNGESIPAINNDPRITKVGRVIRATRLDELPQIFNILKSDMSIVGPRPERLEHVRLYTEEIPEFEYRLNVKAGLTGYAQIYGKYNTNAYDKLRLDLMYIENYSIRLDIKLILMTLQVLLKKESTEGFEKVACKEVQGPVHFDRAGQKQKYASERKTG